MGEARGQMGGALWTAALPGLGRLDGGQKVGSGGEPGRGEETRTG